MRWKINEVSVNRSTVSVNINKKGLLYIYRGGGGGLMIVSVLVIST